MDNELLTPNQVGEILKVKLPTVYAMSSQGTIRKIKIGSLLRFRRSDVEAYISQRVVDARETIEI